MPVPLFNHPTVGRADACFDARSASSDARNLEALVVEGSLTVTVAPRPGRGRVATPDEHRQKCSVGELKSHEKPVWCVETAPH